MAAEIIKTLDRERLTVRAAHGRTGIAAADFSRIRNAALDRFTVDRLMSIINRLGSSIEVRIRVRPAAVQRGARIKAVRPARNEGSPFPTKDYKGVPAAGLPIGSGEIESGHRYVFQNRLKIAGGLVAEIKATR